MEKEFIGAGRTWEREFHDIPGALGKPAPWTEIAKVKGGTLIFIAGQTAWDDTARVITSGHMPSQAEQVYKNIKDALKAAGATVSDIVFERVYTPDMEAFKKEGMPIRGKFYADAGVTTLPPFTLIGVARLALKDFMLEVEVIAAIE